MNKMPGKGKTAVKRAFVDPLKNRNIGRRTGVDVKAGKNIRKNEEGFELFDDYWTESDDESLYLSQPRGRSAANISHHTLSKNRGNGHPPLHSMSPFVPSSVENSAPASAHDKNGAKHGGSNGAPLNYEGEVLGTITRVDSPKNSQAAKEDDQPCSALVNFRMKKRLRYSEAIRKSSETDGSDQAFAVPRQPGKGRRSTPTQLTSENGEALPTTTGSQGSQGSSDLGNNGTSVDSGAAPSEAESEQSEVSSGNNTRKESPTLRRRSSRRSKSIYRHSSSQDTEASQESGDMNGGRNDDSEVIPTEAKSALNNSPSKRRSTQQQSTRKSRSKQRESANEKMQSNTNIGSDVDSEVVPTDASSKTASPRKRSRRSTRKSNSSCPDSSSQETLGSQTNMNDSNTVDSGAAEAESLASEVSQTVDSPRKRSVTSKSSRKKARRSFPDKSSQESQQSSHMNGDTNVGDETGSTEAESQTIAASRNVDSPRKRSVSSRSSRKARSSCPDKSSQESQQSSDMNGDTNVGDETDETGSTEAESQTIAASRNVDSPRKQQVTSRNSPRKSKSSCPENSSQEKQRPQQSTDVNSDSDESQNVDSPRKRSVASRNSQTSTSSCETGGGSEETDFDRSNSKKNTSSPNKSRHKMGNGVNKRVGIDTEHVSEASAGETAVVDSPAAPSQKHRSPSTSPRKQTSCPVPETQSETDEGVASDDNEDDAGGKIGGGVCSEVAMDTDDFLSDSTSETEEQWSVPPVGHLIGACDGLSQMTDHTMDRARPSDVGGHTVGADTHTECQADAADDDRISVTNGDDGGKNSADADGDSDASDVNDDKGQHSLYKTSSPLIIERHKRLHVVRVTSPTKEGATRQDSSSDDVSRQHTSPAKAHLQTTNVTSDVNQDTNGFTSEEDFEIEEPCFRVFGNLKQNSTDKYQGMGKQPQAKARKFMAKSQRSRAKPTVAKKAGTTKVSAIPSPGESEGEEGTSPRLHHGAEKHGKDARKQVSSKTCESPLETPNPPPVPKQKIQSMRRKIDLSRSVHSSPGGSPRNLSDTSVDATVKAPKKGDSTGKLKEIPRDELAEEDGMSESDDSPPHRHPKVAKKGKRLSAQRKNTDEDDKGETTGKRKTVKQGKKRKNPREKGKKQGGKSPKRGRIDPPKELSDDEHEESFDISLGSPRQVLSFENSSQDISLPGSNLSPIEGKRPVMLPGRSPSPPSAIEPSKTKRKTDTGSRRRKSSNPQKMFPATKKKTLALEENLLKPKQLARLKGAKQRRSIYGLTPVVKGLSVASVTPATGPKSILKKGSRYSTATPVHYADTTESAMTPYATSSQPSKNVKIIIPSPSDDEGGVRRSHRTRVLPLDWFRNERILYQPRKSGGFVVAGIVSPDIPEVKKEVRKQRRKVSPKTARSRRPTPTTPRNLSIHQPLPEDCNLVTSSLIPVINPVTEEEVSVECIKSCDAFNFCGPKGKAPTAADPLILCKALNQKAFSVGKLILRPLQEKGTHYVRHDTMAFIIKQGKLAVTIHNTTSVLETDAVFFVPQGNTYNLTNLRNEEAKVWFFQLKQ